MSYRYSCSEKLRPGLNRCVNPNNSEFKLLNYQRIILKNKMKSLDINTEGNEFFLFNLEGEVLIELNNKSVSLNKLDGIYIPPHQSFSIKAEEKADIYVFKAPSTQKTSTRHISYSEVFNNPNLHYFLGKKEMNDRREQFIYLYSKIPASRLLFGFARVEPGNWSSVPPHKHTELMEEIYVFFDMESSVSGIQFVYDDDKDLRHSYFIKDGDAVIIPYGYHPNISFPGRRLNFMWAMAAHREGDRKLIINIQPEFCHDGKLIVEAF